MLRPIKSDEDTRIERQCNLCDKPSLLRRYERFCHPCRKYQEMHGWPGRPDFFLNQEEPETKKLKAPKAKASPKVAVPWWG